MGFLTSLLGIVGFGIGFPIGLLLGFIIFIYFQPREVKDPVIRPLQEYGSSRILDLLPRLPMWVVNPDYERVDWLNRFIYLMWPYLDKAVCETIRSTMKPYFAEYIGKFQIKSLDFETLTLGTLPPIIEGMKVHDSNEKQLVFELPLRWAGNPNIVVAVKLLSPQITAQLIDLHIQATPRITLRPLVPTFPCFSSIIVSLMEKPRVDFGLKVMGGDIMAIPGLYQFIQEIICKEIGMLFRWPQMLEIPILDNSIRVMKKPIGILHAKVLRARKLLSRDFLGASDPYVQLSIDGDIITAKKSTVKKKTLNPEWNEDFKLTVKDPKLQVLQLHLYDWDKVGAHDKLGMQEIQLNVLTPYEKKEFTLDLLNTTNPNDPQNKKPRGQLTVELTFVPFLEESKKFTGVADHVRHESIQKFPSGFSLSGAGLLLVTTIGAEDVEGRYHNNPYARILFRGEKKKTKSIKKTRNPAWNEEFHFVLEEAPLKDKMHIEVLSKRRKYGIRSKEPLGHVDINLGDVVLNGRINEKYHLMKSKDGIIHLDIQWKVI